MNIPKTYTKEHMISLRSKELFPPPVATSFYGGKYTIPDKFKYGSTFDIIQSIACKKCNNDKIANAYYKMFICNICGAHIRYSVREKQYVILSHILNHDTVHPIISRHYDSMKKINILVHTDPDGFCAKCVMCGDGYETKKVNDETIKRHIEKCRRILQLRADNMSLPADLINNFPPPNSPAYLSPNKSSRFYSSHFKYCETAVNKYRRPLPNALAEISLCDHCGSSKIRCRICNVYANSNGAAKCVKEIAYIHLLNTNVTDCVNGIFDNKGRSKIVWFDVSPQQLRGNKAYENMLALDDKLDSVPEKSKKYVVKLIAEKGCLICGDRFEYPSYDMFKHHLDTKHGNDGEHAQEPII